MNPLHKKEVKEIIIFYPCPVPEVESSGTTLTLPLVLVLSPRFRNGRKRQADKRWVTERRTKGDSGPVKGKTI